jgi:tetratricopeptide (TPR) repeat protein
MRQSPLTGHTPFVGRERQLAELGAAIEAAELGEHVLVLIAGEPGIGKTRLVAEATSQISSRVLRSACWADDDAPAFWPWQQLLRILGGQDLWVDHSAAPLGGDARFQLFDSVAEQLAAASLVSPLVLVIDDLHWADEASIRLLRFLTQDVRDRRLAIIGTYRDTDLTPDHPLSQYLDQLIREGLHLTLGGFSREQVAELVGSLTAGEAPGSDMVAQVHRRSGGNPLFVRELVRLLGPHSATIADGDALARLPTGVRAAVARRLAALPGDVQSVLLAAAVIGIDVELAVLGPVTGRSDEELHRALQTARKARLVVDHGADGMISFAHTLVREVLYSDANPADRTRLHHRVAEVLQDRYGDSRVLEVAHHALNGLAESDGKRAADIAVRAAAASLAILAYEDAAAWYARAVELLSRRPDEARVGDLLIRCGEARVAAGDLSGARAAFADAAVVARNQGDAELLATAALGFGAGRGGFEVPLQDPVHVQLLEEALGALGPAPSVLRALVLARLSVALSFLDAEARRRVLSDEAVEVARRVGDKAALGHALAAHCDSIAGPDWCEVRLDESTEIVRLGQSIGDPHLELLGRRLRLVALLEMGDVGNADTEIRRFAHLAEPLRQPLYLWYVPLWRGMRGLMRADVAEAARECAQAEAIGLAHSDNALPLTFTQWWVRQRYEGRFAESGAAMAELLGGSSPGPPITAGPRAVAALQMGDRDKARVLLEQWWTAGLADRPRDSEWLPETAQLAEAAVLTGFDDLAALLYEQLRPYAHRCCVEGIAAACTGSVAWYLAMLARFLGHAQDAKTYHEQARESHRRIGLVGEPPPLAGAPESHPPTETSTATAATLVCEGATWAVTFVGRTRRLRDSKGLRDLAALLARPEQEMHCLELIGGADVGAQPGPALDQQARRAYEGRIRDLHEEIEEARDANDLVRAERAEAELDALVQQLAEAFGLSGRTRATGSAAERARSAVGWRIRSAVRQVAEVHPELGRHLRNSVRTGVWCSYRPETHVDWRIEEV